MRVYFAVLISGFALVFANPAGAQWPTLPTGVPVCTLPSNVNNGELIVSDGAGGAFVAWSDNRVANNVHSAFVQHVGAAGVPLWTPNGVGVITIPNTRPESMIPDGLGGVFVSFYQGSTSTDLYVQRFDSAGNRLWGNGGAPLCVFSGVQYSTQLVPDGAGGVIAVWLDQRSSSGSNFTIYAQRLDAVGAPQWAANGVPATGAVGPFYNGVRVAPDGNGGVVLAWSSFVDIHGQRLDAAGSRLWGANGLTVCDAINQQDHAVLASDGAGGAYIAWWDSRPGNSGLADIYGQHVSAAGLPMWVDDGLPLASAANAQREVEILEDGVGGAFLVWNDFRNGGSDRDLYAQRCDGTGNLLWGAAGVRITPTTTALSSPNLLPSLASDGQGGVIVLYADKRLETIGDIFASRLDAAGQLVWGNGVPVCTVANSQYMPIVTLASDGGAIVAWLDIRTSGNNSDVYVHRIDPTGQVGPPPATPAQMSLVLATTSEGAIELLWYSSEVEEATLEKSDGGGAWESVARLVPDGTGRIAWSDRDVAAGARYGYRLAYLDQGHATRSQEVWVDVPRAKLALAVRGESPGALTVRFTLPGAGAASLRLVDVAGRSLESHDVGGRGRGEHEIALGVSRRLPAGMYFVRLEHAGEGRTARGIVLH